MGVCHSKGYLRAANRGIKKFLMPLLAALK